jgi:Gas vesicle synthesis protein GvpL/GvpF
MQTEATVIYLYCLARPGLETSLPEAGVDGHSAVRVCHFPSATAVVSELALEEFRGPVADARMQDLTWVAPRACRHEQLIEALMSHSPVLPVPFGTLFSSVAGLRQFMETHASSISRFLDQVAGQEEWAVKGFLAGNQARESVLRQELAARAGQLSALPPGKRYIEEQRLQKEAAKTVSGRLQATCEMLAEDLRREASQFAKRKILDSRPEKDGSAPVFNWAFLLPRNAVERFRGQVRLAGATHAAHGLRLELSGPWPPYSFTPSLVSEASE